METNKDKSAAIIKYSSIIIGKLMNISGILQREGNRLLLPYQLNQQQFSVLFEIVRAGEVKQKDMVNRLVLEKAHVSKVVKKLQSMGLIAVVQSADDKRSAFLSPTEKGKQLVLECQAIFAEWKKEQFDNLNEAELLSILESIGKLQEAFRMKKNK